MRSATKKKTGKDKPYLAFIHAQPCCVQSATRVHRGRTEAAHIGPRGLSTKVEDRRALPMCNGHHNGLHLIGPKRFWKKHGQDPEYWIMRFNERFDAGERAE